MQKNTIRAVFVFAVILLYAANFNLSVFAQNNQPKTPLLEETEIQRWREDLRYMERDMEIFHKNLFHTMSRQQFQTAINGLYERIPQLARHQIIVEMARIAAMVGDGHTILRLAHDPEIRFHTLPINLYFFEDGLFIRAANAEYAGLVGARVVRIGNTPVEEATMRVRDLIGRDNEMDVKFFAPFLLIKPEVLHALQMTDNLESVPFTIEKEGKQQNVSIKHTNSTAVRELIDTDTTWLNESGWIDMRDKSSARTPLWLKDINNKFWFELLPDSKILYVQINEVGNKKEESLADFSRRLFEFVEANPVEKLVFDLRLNRGGNNVLLTPLITEIVKSKINRRGKLFTIMGRSTWSAAQNFLNYLERYTNTLFIGEPSGSKGNVYGDSRRITLPNSKITVRVSVYYWQDWYPWDNREWTPPHLTAELSAQDYRNNLDPAMNIVLNYTPQKPLNETLMEALTEGGVNLAVKELRKFTAQPINRYADIEQPIMEAGQRLLNEKKYEDAVILFQLNAAANPHSYRAYFALGATYFALRNKELARKNLEKTLELDPKNYGARIRLRDLEQNK
jgi:hypothetical protein